MIERGPHALAGRCVVVARPAMGTLGDRLTALGADVRHVPLIDIGPPTDGGIALRAALEALDQFDWLVVTSANGAAQVGAAAGGHLALRLAAVGPATASALAALAGRPADLVPDVATAEGLAAAFPVGKSRVLLAQANLAGDRLAAALRGRGHDVVAVEAYSTRLRSPDEAELALLRDADAVVLASGSGVAAWHEAERRDAANPPWSRVHARIVTIGPKTADVAAAAGLTVHVVAAAPTDDGVLDALVAAFAQG